MYMCSLGEWYAICSPKTFAVGLEISRHAGWEALFYTTQFSVF